MTLAQCGEGGTQRSSGSIPAGSAAPGATSPSLTPPPGSIYLGAYVNPSQVPNPPPSLIAGVEQQIGRRFATSLHYYGFYQAFPGPGEAADVANGRIPVISWDCTPSNAAIAAGDADNWIRSRADAVKAFGTPVFLRYMYEMELPSTPRWRPECYDANTDLAGGVFSPQNFIAAWDRIRSIFAQEGVTNVVWLWNPAGEKNLGAYYPGATEVDWVGMDRYDTGDVDVNDTFSASYKLLKGINKPIMVGETGAQESEQDAFFGELPQTLRTSFPLIAGINYFDSARKDNYFGVYVWALADSSIPAFTTMANDPYMSGFQP